MGGWEGGCQYPSESPGTNENLETNGWVSRVAGMGGCPWGAGAGAPRPLPQSEGWGETSRFSSCVLGQLGRLTQQVCAGGLPGAPLSAAAAWVAGPLKRPGCVMGRALPPIGPSPPVQRVALDVRLGWP